MASGVEATIVAEPVMFAADRLLWDEALALMNHFEQRWSRFLIDSDVSRLNRSDGRPVVVDPSTTTLLTTMLDGWHRTGAQFDPTVLPVLVRAGYSSSIDDPSRITILPVIDPTASMLDIVIDGCTVTFPAGLTIDPGGIGKGLAADLTVDRLLAMGAAGALVSIGGDMSMRGISPTAPDGWTVAVEGPDGDTLCALSVEAGGVATSSTRSRRWRQGDREHHHAIDPRHAAPSLTDLASVTVIDRSGWLAEVQATAALLTGSATVIHELEQRDLSGIAITSSGQVLATGDLAAHLPGARPTPTGAFG